MCKGKFLNQNGLSLVEGLVGLIIIATAVTAIFSVIISSFTADKKNAGREEAAFVLKKASEKIKAYVTADGDLSALPADIRNGICSAAKEGISVKDPDPLAINAAGHDISCLLVDSAGHDLYPSYPYNEWKLGYKVAEVPGCAVEGSLDTNAAPQNPGAVLKCRQLEFSLETRD
ncbi:MAG: hypothetical protein PHW69_04185 [Elusimicrobiaceae bacterium]|nr:hypothetical protein [Elusimicrobiaceae bacterium]